MKDKMRPLTKTMIRHLRLARAKELSETKDIITSDDFKGTLGGLYQRGFVNTRKISAHGKQIEGVYLTFVGINFLKRHEEQLAKKNNLE